MEFPSLAFSSIRRPLLLVSSPSSISALFANNATATFLNKTNMGITSPLSLGRIRTRTRRPRRGLTCKALFGLGVPELVVIAGVAALVFGPKKLPEVGKSIGKTVKSFQQAAKEFESELKQVPESGEVPPTEKPAALDEQEKQDVKVPSPSDTV